MTNTARFHDGETSAPHTLHITIDSTHLIGTNAVNEIIIKWPIAALQLIEKPDGNRPAIVTHSTTANARLFINQVLFELLLPKLHKKQIPRARISTSSGSIILWLTIAIIVSILTFTLLSNSISHIARHIPQNWQTTLGDYILESLTEHETVCRNPISAETLSVIRSTFDPEDIHKLKFTIIENGEMNAFATAGGHIVIYSGLIQEAESQEEFLGVIAHEIAHVMQHHPMEGAVRSLGLSLIMQLMLGFTDDISLLGKTLIDFHYSREAERKADQIAVTMLKEHNINPNGLTLFFRRLKSKEDHNSSKLLTYLSTHPSTSERIADTKQPENTAIYHPLLSDYQWRSLQRVCNTTSSMQSAEK